MVEAGLGHLPFAERTVTTPTGRPYVGVDFAKRLCGVSIIRSGESMENALRACCQGIKIGKILVHRCVLVVLACSMLSSQLWHINPLCEVSIICTRMESALRACR